MPKPIYFMEKPEGKSLDELTADIQLREIMPVRSVMTMHGDGRVYRLSGLLNGHIDQELLGYIPNGSIPNHILGSTNKQGLVLYDSNAKDKAELLKNAVQADGRITLWIGANTTAIKKHLKTYL